MTADVIEFQKPKLRPAVNARQQAEPKRAPMFNVNDRNEWVLAVKAAWADPDNWRTSKKGNRYIVIEEIGVCVVIERSGDEGYWSWEIRWQCGRRPMASNWTYIGEKGAYDEALDAVLVLA